MTRVLLVTANVGSIFEDEALMEEWVAHFAQSVIEAEPQFVALHCQEVGGKHARRVSTDRFFGALVQSLPPVWSAQVLVDADAEAFTALGSVYLWREELETSVWHFEEKRFVGPRAPLSSQHVVHKSKFPPSVTSEASKARKGFMRTRWRVRGLTLDLVNVHLFHDACNVRACQEFPSQFARTRRAALEWTLERVHDQHVPLFVFGDFNFRLDARAFINAFADGPSTARDDQLAFRDANDQLVLRIARKSFEFRDKHVFGQKWQSLRALDKEMQPFAERLLELPIAFPPSYPFGEDLTSGLHYMSTRCPAWCDRILLSPSARSLVEEHRYWAMGASHAMGDHKPVALVARLCQWRYVRTTRGHVFRETSL